MTINKEDLKYCWLTGSSNPLPLAFEKKLPHHVTLKKVYIYSTCMPSITLLNQYDLYGQKVPFRALNINMHKHVVTITRYGIRNRPTLFYIRLDIAACVWPYRHLLNPPTYSAFANSCPMQTGTIFFQWFKAIMFNSRIVSWLSLDISLETH